MRGASAALLERFRAIGAELRPTRQSAGRAARWRAGKVDGGSEMANREQKSNREKLKPKKDKQKDVPAATSSYKEQFGKPKRK